MSTVGKRGADSINSDFNDRAQNTTDKPTASQARPADKSQTELLEERLTNLISILKAEYRLVGRRIELGLDTVGEHGAEYSELRKTVELII